MPLRYGFPSEVQHKEFIPFIGNSYFSPHKLIWIHYVCLYPHSHSGKRAFSGERVWKAIGDRLQRSQYLSRADHDWKIRSRRQRKDTGKYSFVNWTIQYWNWLPAEVLRTLPYKPVIFKKRVRTVIIEMS